ncbi:hypothetical protein CsSME_00052430 [Camellia sinensis var. sinensis]
MGATCAPVSSSSAVVVCVAPPSSSHALTQSHLLHHPPTEHVPRVLPKDEDPSLVNRNKRMLGQLLGTLEREIYYITFSILKYPPLKTIIIFSTAQTFFTLYIYFSFHQDHTVLNPSY